MARQSTAPAHPPSHDEVLERRLAAVRRGSSAVGWQPDADLDPDVVGRAPLLPDPGRHASRRPWAQFAAVPVWLGPTQLAVVAVLVAATLCLAAWWVLRSDARAVEAPATSVGLEPAPELVAITPAAAGSPLPVPAPAGGTSSGAAPTDVATGAGEQTGEVLVDVAGRVRRPGVVTLPAGSRVVDALDAAGGARPGVDLVGLNLARVLVDGEQVLVGAPAAPAAGPASAASAPPAAAPAPGAAPGSPAASGAPVALVDLNTADLATLETLPQVGPVTGQAIITWRDQNGGFTAVEELLEVDGIGEVTLAQIAPHATV